MADRQSRWVKAYIMHGRSRSRVIDYDDFFNSVANLPQRSTRVQLRRDLVLAINRMSFDDGSLKIRFASGNPDEIPLLYDETTGEMVIAATPEGMWLAAATHVVVMPSDRLMLIEGRRNGVGATNLERYLVKLAQQNQLADRLSFDISPLPSASFETELDRYSRIREASIEVSRPNWDWDDASDILSDVANESNARSAQIVVNAERGESLDKQGGIVGTIRTVLREGVSNIRGIQILGRRENERLESALTLDKHQVRKQVEYDESVARDVEDEIMFSAEVELGQEAKELLRERRASSVGESGDSSRRSVVPEPYSRRHDER